MTKAPCWSVANSRENPLPSSHLHIEHIQEIHDPLTLQRNKKLFIRIFARPIDPGGCRTDVKGKETWKARSLNEFQGFSENHYATLQTFSELRFATANRLFAPGRHRSLIA